ncbi:hypothetical protein EOB59_30485 [Mesorhizobium sp. M7A.F.Ca.MR.176.00.0.0]|nr:hypothetical protein EOB59_30485 [Mesorhizobium sp. M7A.F.Ca.MR.176.00.0.0]
MYFGAPLTIPPKVSIIPKSSSATYSLAQSLSSWGNDTERSTERELDAKKVVLESLTRREDRAVTAAIFAAAGSRSLHPESAIGIVRRQISAEYTRHFMSTINSDIATGVRGLGFFDSISRGFPEFDVQILMGLARALGIVRILEQDWETYRSFWESFYYRRSANEGFFVFLEETQSLMLALARMFADIKLQSAPSFRILTNQTLERVGSYLSYGDVNLDDGLFETLNSRMRSIVDRLSNSHEFRNSLEFVKSERNMRSSYDFLLIVATEIERSSVFDKAREIGNKITPYFGGGRGYYDLGYIYGNRVALVKVEMGSLTVGGSATTTVRMVDQLNPRYIIMVGIAFGTNEKKQSIGTVLVSRQILSYDQQRVGTDEKGDRELVIRGDRSSASPILVSLLETASGVWNEAPVKTGLMLSGDKLVDNLDFREQLKSIAGGEAIGGEMEGCGLVVAASESSAHWVVVKAICDWADGKKSTQKKSRQALAAKNAVSFVFQALRIGPNDGITQ